MSSSSYGVVFYGAVYDESELEVVFGTDDPVAAAREVADSIGRTFGCGGDQAGHFDSSGPLFVYVQTSLRKAEWGEVVPLRREGEINWRERFAGFLAAMRLPDKEPRWYLTSQYR